MINIIHVLQLFIEIKYVLIDFCSTISETYINVFQIKKISTEAKGEKWSIETSNAENYIPKKIISNSSSSSSTTNNSYQNQNPGTGGRAFEENWEENSYQR